MRKAARVIINVVATVLMTILLLLSNSGIMRPVGSMRFDLQSGTTKCITEDIQHNAMTVANYALVPVLHHNNNNNNNNNNNYYSLNNITLKVTSPYGNNYHTGEHVESGTFAFTAAEGGDYMACFWAPDHNPAVSLSVEFDWKTGVAAKDWSNVAKKGQIDVMEIELKKLLDTVTYIHDEMFYLRDREDEMQKLNIATNLKMATFSFLSLVVCLSVAGLQLWHLKTFFERKKLL